MQYMGGKSRLAKHFAPILDAALERCGGRFFEPFVGGFNVVPALTKATSIYCSDVHPGVISLWRAVASGWAPPEHVGSDAYKMLRALADWSNPLTAFAAFGLSFGAKEWNGKMRERRDMEGGVRRSIELARPFAARCRFGCQDYAEDPSCVEARCPPSVIYCDPPYAGTTEYRGIEFDRVRFPRWCEAMARVGHEVFVSEFTGPAHWPVVWERSRSIQMNSYRGEKIVRTERLFRVQVGVAP